MSTIHTGPYEDVEIPDVDITSFVFEHAGERADKPALIDGPSGRTLTYSDVTRGIRALASGLAARGFGKGDVLAVYMPNVPEYAIAFHGATSAGGMATTMNPLYTANEVAHQLEDSGAKLLVTVGPFLEAAGAAAEQAGIGEEVYVVGGAEDAKDFTELLGDPDEAPELEVNAADDLAVLPYSSGTTGLPKGVMLTHRNLVANLNQTLAAQDAGEDDVLVGVLPFFHIYGMQVIMNLGLRQGATVVTMPRFDLDQFLSLIEEHGVTNAYVVPPIALALAKHPAVDEHDVSSLRMIMSGAAPLGAELSDAVEKRTAASTIQGYGLTETSPVTHCIPASGGRSGSIGPPLPNTECRIVDPESGEDVAQGERGELWIRGPQVMKGYLNNDEATAATIDDEGWLHTGDIAVVGDDGDFEIVDRLKELIKYKGFQVPPAELEALLITHPKVQDVAVIGVADEEAGELPKAYIVPGENVDHDELMAWVGERVAPQKKIRLIEEIDEIPKSPSGKILRRKLVERERETATG
jgi:acyl-CoA synthetase (AMP-forming)/AMP-acid ligase II